VWIVFFSVYALCAWKVVYGLKLKLWSFGALVSSIQSFVVLRCHGHLVCTCLVCEVLLIY
ncbi:hypothetical protein HID58_047983, partial [Brassica napus]